MRILFRIFALLLAGLLAVFVLSGCESDEDIEDEKIPVSFVSAAPPSGSSIAANASIILTFNGEPKDVTVSAGAAVTSGNTVTVNGPFFLWGRPLIVTWADGTVTLFYHVLLGGFEPPEVTGGSIRDGDKDVDPEAINSDGKIEITFSEEMTGHIALQTEAGDNVGWIGKVEGNKATLELVKGRELGNETTYVIAGKVADAAGNAADISITFVTSAKE